MAGVLSLTTEGAQPMAKKSRKTVRKTASAKTAAKGKAKLQAARSQPKGRSK